MPTLIGCGAVLLWATLALFTVMTGDIPPLQLNAMCFAVGGALGLVWTIATGGLDRLRGVRPAVWVLGVGGLFGYHFFYFTALKNAPPAEAGLIAYLWPLLIVLFSGLLPGEQLRRGHIIGAVVAFSGAAAILLQADLSFSGEHALGYGAAILCALLWSSYSVLSRRVGDVPTEVVALFCLATAALSALAHLGLEQTVWPATTETWLGVILLGLGPVGLAFYLWDIGVKKGNIQLLGTASYAAPLLSTLLLVATGRAPFTATLALSALLVTGGAIIAARAGRRAQS
ncbi:aromatic amino acid exporter YddG [Pontivivens insulae]|uniref:Aromatic amino acid exporter YddG n=1 Tax=Pontivivens insulae TaxID=1639689 RepID=A0A2R8A994_9RHOB|nr:EamA family transporter [Pontivivens insulae]RED12710.1 drug/metabolite transporter (DMT)-like permease [Pontivivens insulae]SPF28801.1 Aromatic amino acid exporter YddG [Pontivivens insulae]